MLSVYTHVLPSSRKAYHVASIGPKTIGDAKDYCESQNGTLATLTNAEEMDFVRGLGKIINDRTLV